jgi:succinate dehydrogenase/fumarate reductase flavoprotein subunit
MWEAGGILRNETELSRALDSMREILESFSFSGSRIEKNLTPAQTGAIELRSATRAAALILEAAIRRKESRGSHYMEDYPKQNDRQWLGHLQVGAAPEGDAWEFVHV